MQLATPVLCAGMRWGSHDRWSSDLQNENCQTWPEVAGRALPSVTSKAKAGLILKSWKLCYNFLLFSLKNRHFRVYFSPKCGPKVQQVNQVKNAALASKGPSWASTSKCVERYLHSSRAWIPDTWPQTALRRPAGTALCSKSSLARKDSC